MKASFLCKVVRGREEGIFFFKRSHPQPSSTVKDIKSGVEELVVSLRGRTVI